MIKNRKTASQMKKIIIKLVHLLLAFIMSSHASLTFIYKSNVLILKSHNYKDIMVIQSIFL